MNKQKDSRNLPATNSWKGWRKYNKNTLCMVELARKKEK